MPAASSDPEEEQATPVQVTQIQKGNLSQRSEIIGTAVPSKEADVYPKMTGELVQVAVKDNDQVAKGAVLARIDSDNLRIQLELEQLALDQAQSQYKDLLRSNAPESQLEQVENNVRQIQLRIQLAQNNMNHSVISAPIAGTVASANMQAGDFVSTGAPVAKIVQLNPIRIKASLSTNQMLALQQLEEVQVALPDVNISGQARIVNLSNVADNAGFYTLEAEMDNAEGVIKSGMMAKLQLESAIVQDELIVPTSAIIEKGGISYVFVVRDSRAAEVPLTILESQSDVTAVEGDLSEGENIVVKGQYTLSDGGLVHIVEGAE